jgi:PAS domain S-box-containing protein
MKQNAVFDRIATFRNLPSLPHILLELLDACEQDDTTFKDLSQIIEKDPSLSAKVMSLVNSAYYNRPYKATSLYQTLTLLGFDAVKNISISSSVYRTFDSIKGDSVFNVGLFWWHSFLCANTSKLIAKKISYSSPEEAFLAGLLHDIGRVVLWTNFPKEYSSILQADSGSEWSNDERTRFGVDHGEVGAWMITRWDLKSFMADAILYHHESPDRIADSLPLVKIVYVANALCKEMEGPGDAVIKIAHDTLGLTPVEIDKILSEAHSKARQTAKSLEIDVEAVQDFRASPAAEKYEMKQSRLAEKVMDITLLHGTVRNLLGACGEDAILRIAIEGLQILFDVESAIFFAYDTDRDILVGKCGLGTRDNDLIGQMEIPFRSGASIMIESMNQQKVVDSFSCFKSASPTLLDEQLIRLSGTDGILCVPMIARGEFAGAIVLGISKTRAELIYKNLELLTLLSGHVALALQTDRLSRRLSKLSALKASIVDHSPLMILSVDAGGKVIHMNPQAQNVFKPVASNAIGFFEVFKQTEAEVRHAIAKMLEGTETIIPPFRYTLSSGDVIWLSGKGLPLPGEEVEDKNFLILLEDITKRVILEAQNREYATRLEEKVRIGGEALKEAHSRLIQSERLATAGALARKVAHEVNNPLSIIKNYLKILELKTAKQGDVGDEFNIISEEIDRVAFIVGELSDFSRPGIQKPEPVDISTIISNLIKISHESLLVQSNITVDFRQAPSSLTIVTDKNKIKQIFINLIKNAVEAMPNGGRLFIETRWAPEKNLDEQLQQYAARGLRYAEISIRDEGKGIPAELRSHLFDPFVSSKGEGHAGIGLSITYTIIKELRGTITYESEEGKGTIFRIFLPEKQLDDLRPPKK